MKYKILLFVLLISTLSFSQNFEEQWKEVMQLELDGKTKSADEIVTKIYRKANRKNNEPTIIKCFFYKSKFLQVLDENASEKIILDIKEEIKEASKPSKGVLNYIYAQLLNKYLIKNSTKIYNRTPIQNNKSQDFLTWSYHDFISEIEKAYEESVKYKLELRQVSVKDYKEIFEISPYLDGKNYSLYDFLSEKYLNYFGSKINFWKIINDSNQEELIAPFYDINSNFSKLKSHEFNQKNLEKVIAIFQEKETYAVSQSKDLSDLYIFNRVRFFHNHLNSKKHYINSLTLLLKSSTNENVKQDIKVSLASFYYTNANKVNNKDYLVKALELTENVLNQKINSNALVNALSIKNTILEKYLSINLNKVLYPNQNARALVYFKNIDSIKISYYRLPIESNFWFAKSKQIKDSLVTNFISKNKPIKSYFKVLPNKGDHFENSTEILLEKIEAGNYLVLLTPEKIDEDYAPILTYENILVTSMMFHDEYSDKTDDFYIYDRKTGKPLENVLIRNNEKNIFSNKEGKVNIEKETINNEISKETELFFIKDSDTIKKMYTKRGLYNYNYSSEEFENFEAKANVFFDRAIYRPGQKVYFKGILLQKKALKKSVVPFVSVKVIVEDSKNKTIKEYEIQTNEFGSFSGEFEIPKNILNGEFSLHIEEPDNFEKDKKYYDEKEKEHIFWDNVDFQTKWYGYKFRVEEYKRPTFEIKFDEIKERYTIGDTLKISGNVKTLAGSNVTGAKVVWNVDKDVYMTEYYPNQENEIITIENVTDENGNFSISLVATDSILKNNKIRYINYNIEVAITGLNGETKVAKKNVRVGQKTLELSATVKEHLYKEDTNNLIIKAENLNKYPIHTKGEITFYEIKKKDYLFQRQFQFPETQIMSRSEFELLFPHEPYDQSDVVSEKKIVKTIPFDTQNGNSIDLNFLKELKKGSYSFIITALDIKKDTITYESQFNLDSKVDIRSKEELFTYKIDSKSNDFVTIEFQSEVPNLYITTRAYENDKKYYFTTIQLVNGKGILKVNKTRNQEKDYHYHFVSFYENKLLYHETQLNNITIENNLDLEITNIRNKVEPGSNENWSFKIKNQKIESEVLASMYDSSLDIFAKKEWENTFFVNQNRHPDFPSIYKFINYENIAECNFKFTSFSTNYSTQKIDNPRINWYGFEYLFISNDWEYKTYQKALIAVAEIPENANLITGVVSDEIGPIAGANVVVQGTIRGTTTDFDGNFEIFALPGETLVFSYTGKRTTTRLINNPIIYISLNDDVLQGSEVVLTAYGIVRETKKLAYATKKVIDENELSQYENQNVLTALSGSVSGLNIITANSSNPSTIVTLRGYRSLSSEDNALIVVDGKIVSGDYLNTLAPNSIFEIQIIKDSEATALYGNEGKNGVIIITTKNALKELAQVKTRTNFNETAFFYPHLTTDSEGKVNFKFTTPESLTKWKLRMYAHNKKAETGYLEADIISQKDLMIMPNMPRFVRENDSITVTAKVANLTNEAKSGIALLQLFDATTGKSIDVETLNSKNTKNFNCKAKENTAVSWTISIPEGLQGLQYKIIAKSGNFSDGEENILPVLSNSILVTESIPLWVREKSKKEVVFENLKNNDSKTLRNHLFTLEYTSNPVWMAIQSLPYLMEYEHECAEQTFSRYYANFIAKQIIESNPKVASVLESWKNQGKTKSKLEINEELKSILLAETPWFFDADEDAKNKQLAVLFDLNKLKESSDATLKKLEDKMMPSGGFPWFNGGNESRYITQHILAGLGHLDKLFSNSDNNFDNITKKAIPYLDVKFIESKRLNKLSSPSYNPTDIHYLYTRSFYLKQYPISKQIDSIIKVDLADLKKKWLDYSLYQKGMMALVMHRFNEKEFAKKIITHLKETSASNENDGMYWIDNRNGYYWYESKIETQALIIEAFAEIENDTKSIDAMKVWLIRNKQIKNWNTTKSTSEAIYALLLQGTDWTTVKDNTKFKIGSEKILSQKLTTKDKEAETGYIKMNWNASEISKEMATISVDNKSEVPGYGGVYWQYFENLEKIKSDNKGETQIQKELFKNVTTKAGTELIPITKETLKVGDLITIRLTIKTEVDLEYVHLKDLRASCFEPVNVISKYIWDGASYYMSTKDVATHFFFDSIKQGTYIIDYEVRITNSGSFNNGIATLQSMYAPEFSSHSKSEKVKIN